MPEPVIDQNYRNKIANINNAIPPHIREMIDGMSDADKQNFKSNLQSMLMMQSVGGGNSLGDMIGKGMQGVGSALTGQPMPQQQPNLNQQIMAAQMQNQMANQQKQTQSDQTLARAKDLATFKAGLQPRNQEKPIDRVNLEIQQTKLADLKQKDEDKQQKAEDAATGVKTAAQDMLNAIASVKEGAKYFGPYGNTPTLATSLGGMVDYAPRKKWENNVNKLLAKKGLDIMLELKNASKTGATGFGQLSEKEGTWLRNASTALTRDLAPNDAMDILNEMERLYTKVLSGGGSAQVGNGQQTQDVPAGYKLQKNIKTGETRVVPITQ